MKAVSAVLAEVVARAIGTASTLTLGAPHVRAAAGSDQLLAWFVLASLPAVVVGCWSLGDALGAAAIAAGGDTTFAAWRGGMVAMSGSDGVPGVLASLMLGLTFFVPLLVVAVVVAVFWHVVFATRRRQPPDPGIWMTAWLFAALLPASLPLPMAALGLSFGAVLGSLIFGGTGRYLVSPALLGIVFLNLAYPDLLGADRWLPGLEAATTWSTLAIGGSAALETAGTSWIAVFAGQQIGALGATSALACLFGAGLLIARGAASWRTLAGGLAGLWLAAGLGGDGAVPAHWHLAVGSFAFGLAFIATDPTTLPLTRLGRWLHGGTIGALVIAIRVLNPAHPEATLLAILIASLFTPLFDCAVVAWYSRALRRETRE